MTLKEYEFNGSTWQFDDKKVPAGAVLVEAEPVVEEEHVEQPEPVEPESLVEAEPVTKRRGRPKATSNE